MLLCCWPRQMIMCSLISTHATISVDAGVRLAPCMRWGVRQMMSYAHQAAAVRPKQHLQHASQSTLGSGASGPRKQHWASRITRECIGPREMDKQTK